MNKIYLKKGIKTGKTVAIFGGVHGNEPVGVKIIDELQENLKIDCGEVYLVYANPQAINMKVRYIEDNLNRCMVRGKCDDSIEKIRAQELMMILDKCEALLDIHSFTNPRGEAFAICEKNSFDVARYFDIPVISSGWTDVEPGGTDDYMFRNNKIGICLECGPHNDNKTIDIARQASKEFLKYFGLIDNNVKQIKQNKRYIHVYKAIFRQHDKFSFSKDYNNFDKLEVGEVFATDGDIEYKALAGDCIVLPTPNEPIGGEVCVIGREYDNNDK